MFGNLFLYMLFKWMGIGQIGWLGHLAQARADTV